MQESGYSVPRLTLQMRLFQPTSYTCRVQVTTTSQIIS